MDVSSRFLLHKGSSAGGAVFSALRSKDTCKTRSLNGYRALSLGLRPQWRSWSSRTRIKPAISTCATASSGSWDIPNRKRLLSTHSFTHGPTEHALFEGTIPQHFDSIVDRYPNRPAVISYAQDQELTYKELQAESNAIARGLQAHGVKKGDRVAVSMGNTIEFGVLTYAIFRLGAILVPLNPGFTPKQVTAALKHLDASHLLIGAETKLPFREPVSNTPIFEALLGGSAGSKVKSSAVPSLTHIIVKDNTGAGSDIFTQVPALTRYETIRDADTSFPSVTKLDANEVANIQFTSGTTSMPKAAMLTHRNILNNGIHIGDGLQLTEQDVICCPPPLFHCFGSVLGYMATATHGAAILFPSPSFDPKLALEATAKYRATGLYGVPTMFLAEIALLNKGTLSLPADGFSRLRTGIAAGSSVPAEVMRKLHRTMNLTELAICYGQTETSPVSCMTTAADPLQARVETVGRVMPHIHAKVVDPVTREVLPLDTRGELAVSGYSVMKGYWGDEIKTKEALIEARDDPNDPNSPMRIWMHSGDEAAMDSDGYVRITGRIKDLIIRGGENVNPLEIENCILAMETVEDVSVVGVKDEHYGEVVGAFVVRSASGKDLEAQQVRDYVSEHLSRHLIPKYVFFVETFPKTSSGKIQKFALRASAEELVRQGVGSG